MATGDDVEKMLNLRRQMLISGLIGFPMFLGAQMAMLRTTGGEFRGLPGVLAVIGAAICGISMVLLVALMVRFRARPDLAKRLADELWWANRYKAAMFAFIALIDIQGVGVGLLTRWPEMMSPAMLAYLNLIVGFTAFVGAFLYLDGKE